MMRKTSGTETPQCGVHKRMHACTRRGVSAVVALIGILATSVPMEWPRDFSQSHWVSSPASAQTSSRSPAALPDFADIVERVKPAVAGVNVQIQDQVEGKTTGRQPRRSPGQQDSPHQFGSPGERPGVPQSHANANVGSGFFISADGYLITTNHLIERAGSIAITTDDNKTHSAKLVGTDAKSDLALLKVESNQQFPFVRLADRTPRVGEWVLAVGNPYGLGGTITRGIVSARPRDLKMGTYNDFLQIDASINQGNSGGPTFDLEGNVIGVNSAILAPGGGSTGIGFAIPADTVKTVVGQLKEKGKVTRGWLGIRIQAVTEEIAQRLAIKQAQGALVVDPQPGGPAAKAGIAAGDIITSLNGESIKDDRELMKKIGDLAPGTEVQLAVLRKGEVMAITLTLGELPG
jgi:serine protease Do